jgi:hypothetical protein
MIIVPCWVQPLCTMAVQQQLGDSRSCRPFKLCLYTAGTANADAMFWNFACSTTVSFQIRHNLPPVLIGF